MVRWLSRFFNYLDRYYIQRHNLHPLNDVGLLVFRGEPDSQRRQQGESSGAGSARCKPAATLLADLQSTYALASDCLWLQ